MVETTSTFITTSTFVIFLLLVLSVPTISISSFLWWCLREIRKKIERRLEDYQSSIIKMMTDFQDIQRNFLTISKQVDTLTKEVETLTKRIERLEK